MFSWYICFFQFKWHACELALDVAKCIYHYKVQILNILLKT